MWQQYLANKEFNTLYFNVWENDFISDPIIGFIGEFKELSNKYQLESELDKITTTASQLFLSTFPTLIEALAKQKFGNDAVETIKGCTKGVTDVLSKEFENYEKQKNSIKKFHEALQNFVDKCNSGKPLIFFVDELDRCCPAYAVKVLERIKHLFSIPNIVFVLSVDKKQLCNAIKGYYGSESLDAENYLKRFIDIEYNLPEPNYEDFCNYLYDKFEIGKHINNLEYGSDFVNFSIALFQYNKLSLRQMEKIYSHVSLAISCNKKLRCDSMLFLFFVFIKICHSETYISFEQKKYEEPQKFVDDLEPFLPISSSNFDIPSYVLARAIYVYFSQFEKFSLINLHSVSFHKTDSNTINKEIERSLSTSSPRLIYNTIIELIDLLINFD